MTSIDRLLATVGLSALLCASFSLMASGQSELPEVTVKQTAPLRIKPKARPTKARPVVAATRRPAPRETPVQAARVARAAAPATRTATAGSNGTGGAPGTAGAGLGAGAASGAGAGSGIGNGTGVGVGDGAGGSNTSIGPSAPVQSRFDAAEQRLQTKVGTNQYDIGRRGIEELPQGDNTPIERVLL